MIAIARLLHVRNVIASLAALLLSGCIVERCEVTDRYEPTQSSETDAGAPSDE